MAAVQVMQSGCAERKSRRSMSGAATIAVGKPWGAMCRREMNCRIPKIEARQERWESFVVAKQQKSTNCRSWNSRSKDTCIISNSEPLPAESVLDTTAAHTYKRQQYHKRTWNSNDICRQ